MAQKTLTRFIKQTAEDINVIYDVRLDVKGDGEVIKDNLTPLSKTEIAMFRARQKAMHAAPKDCARGYNTAVMEDIDSNGWLVYILAATKENAVVVGGHSRVKVSPDGNNVLAVTPLYKSCLTIPIPADVNNAKQEALYINYPLADVPSEIHVYLNRLHGYPVYVTTEKKRLACKGRQNFTSQARRKNKTTGNQQGTAEKINRLVAISFRQDKFY